jgi:hypothetical protein
MVGPEVSRIARVAADCIDDLTGVCAKTQVGRIATNKRRKKVWGFI